jgi:hypothetical protein
MQDRADHVGGELLDLAAELVGDGGDRHVGGQRRHDQLLQRAQLLVLPDVAEQADQIFDLAARVAVRLDVRRGPDLAARLVIDQQVLLDALRVDDALLQPVDHLGVGAGPDEELLDILAEHLLRAVAEDAGKGRVGIEDLQLVIGDDDGAVAAVGHRGQQRVLLTQDDVVGDVLEEEGRLHWRVIRRKGARAASQPVP